MPQAQYLSTDPNEGVDWSSVIHAEATKQGVDPQLALSVARTESALNPKAKSPKGALGLMQLMPETAKRHGVDPADPYQNIQGGVAELKQLLAQNNGDTSRALALYNGSPQAPASATAPYVQKVQAGMSGGAAPAAATAPKYLSTDPNEGLSPAVQPPPGPNFLGASTKPAHITGPPGLGETLRRSLPELGGALGMALGTEGGPLGVATGAYIGGHTGKALQQAAQALGFGPPPPPTFAEQQAARHDAATGQMANAAVGEGVGAVLPGGVLKVGPGITRAVRANTAENLGVSLPEMLKGTKMGTALEGVNQLAERSTVGRLAATQARTRWAPAIRQAYAQGKVTLQDIGAAKGALETGEGLVDNRAMKAEAQRLIDTEVTPRAEHYGSGAPPVDMRSQVSLAPPKGGGMVPPPAAPPTSTDTDAILRGGVAPSPTPKPQPQTKTVGGFNLARFSPADRAMLEQMAKPTAAPKGASPIVKELYNTVNSPDQVPFNAAVKQRGKFWDLSRTPPGMEMSAEQGQALAMHGKFTQTLEDQNPAWGDLSHTYHDLRQQVAQPFVKKIIKQDPEAWGDAIAKAQRSKPYTELTGDQEGQQAIQRLKDIGAAAARRDPTLPSRGWMPILELTAMGTGHGAEMAATEGLSGLYTYAMYNPKVSQWLIQGFKAPNAQTASVAFTQAVQAWRAGQREDAPPMAVSHAHGQGQPAAAPPPGPAGR